MSAFSTRARPSVDEQSDEDGAPARPMPLRSTRPRSSTVALLDDSSVLLDVQQLRSASRLHVMPEDVHLTPEPIPTPAFLGDSARAKSRAAGSSSTSSHKHKQQQQQQEEEEPSQSSSSSTCSDDDDDDDLDEFGTDDEEEEDDCGDVELASLADTHAAVWSRRSVGGGAARRAAGRALARWRQAHAAAEQHALVLFDFVPRSAHELALHTGELVTVTECADFDWWRGRNSAGHEGVFPSNFCQVITSRRELRRLRLQQEVLARPRAASTVLDADEAATTPPTTPSATPAPHSDRSSSSSTPAGAGGREDGDSSVPPAGAPAAAAAGDARCGCGCDRSEVISHKMLLFLVILGTLTSATSWLMDLAIDALISVHRAPLPHMHWTLQLLYWLAFTVVLVRLTHFMVQHLSLHCAGSGIPEVKVVLSGIAMPQYISKTVLFGKVVGLVLVVGAGIFAGKQGPMVHIGVMIATALMDIPVFRFVRDTPEMRLLALTTGGACGLASHFGTSITGILFSLELFPSFMPIRTFWFSCISATVASMIRRATYNLTNNPSLRSITAPILSDITLRSGTWQTQIWTFALTIVVGIACAFFAVVFMQCARTFANLRKYIQRFPVSRGQTLYLFVPVPPFTSHSTLSLVPHLFHFHSVVVCILTGICTFPPWMGDLPSRAPFAMMHNLLGPDLNSDSSLPSSDPASAPVQNNPFAPWNNVAGLVFLLVSRVCPSSHCSPFFFPFPLWSHSSHCCHHSSS